MTIVTQDYRDERRVEVRGSARTAPLHPRVGEVDPTATETVTVYLRGPEVDDSVRVEHEDFAVTYGASSEDVAVLARFASAHNLSLGEVEPARRRAEVTGRLADLAAAFGAELALYGSDEIAPYRGRQGALTVPEEVAAVVTGVFGLDQRPQATPKFRVADTASISYTPPQVAAAYNFPTAATGAGQCIGLIELGGGFRQEDITAYFASLGLSAPEVDAVLVDGATNDPTTANGPDGEVMLDIEVAGSVAPGASIAVYFAPNTDRGFLDAITTAVHDTQRKPSVLSISWGGPESTWTSQAMEAMEQAFIAAAALGVTVTVASGDHGSTDGVADGQQHVDFPASAPHALACGGTRLEAANGQIQSETVWNDGTAGGAGGGGISATFPVPSYQSGINLPPSANDPATPGRGVPDVAGDADPDSGYSVRVDGSTMTIGGTSAVAPLWAGLIALVNESRGTRAGFLHPSIYAARASTDFHDITSGSNGAYSGGPGWDACTGLGTPDGTALLSALASGGAAGSTA